MGSKELAMTAWTRICCAVDFGDASRVALDRAADLARRLDAELTLLHVVVPLPAVADATVLVSSQELDAAQAREDEAELARWAASAERALGRAVRTRVLAGDAAAVLVRHAREEGCDLLVLGTHGRGGLPRLVLGSVAERVVRQAPCPVLVVHDGAALAAGAEAEELSQYT
jgi:nucleotide-binding universal stress UspA family protein